MRLIDLDRIKPMDFPSTGMDGLDAVRYLNTLPTIDAVHVVRCRECKHLGFCGDATNLEVMGFYGYCSRGERKEGAD